MVSLGNLSGGCMENVGRISITSNAKINLFLDINSRRSDGYHTLNSLMHSISLADTVDICVRAADKTEIILTSDADIPLDKNNLAYRAAEAFLSASGDVCAVEINIEKNIPIAGGLAGGSADAAAVLRGLNVLFDNRFDTAELCKIGGRLGADIPFCIVGGSKKVSDIGTVLDLAPVLPECHIVIACAGEGVSTPVAYGQLDSMYACFDGSCYAPHGADFEKLMSAMEKSDLAAVCGSMYNIFEDVVLPTRPVAQKIKSKMQDAGAVGVMMSGSGPSIFGIFDDENTARQAIKLLAEDGIVGHLCVPVSEY